MKRTSQILMLLFSFILNAQSNFDCDKFLKKEIDPEIKDPVQFRENLFNFKYCGLDVYDVEIITTNITSLIIDLSLEKKNSKITFGMLLGKMMLLKNTASYTETRETYMASKELENKIARVENWNEDKQKLEMFIIEPDLLNQFHDFITENSGKNTYKEIFTLLNKKEDTESADFEFENYGDANLDDLLKEATKLNKPLLIYFSGYSCVNSRKIEHLLIEKNLTNIIKDKFYFACLYVDDKSELAKNKQYKSVLGTQVKTVGQKHSDFQIRKFGVNVQPYFAILSPSGAIIATEHYTADAAIFQQFLAKAL